jgi:hypothetical protein
MLDQDALSVLSNINDPHIQGLEPKTSSAIALNKRWVQMKLNYYSNNVCTALSGTVNYDWALRHGSEEAACFRYQYVCSHLDIL